MVIKDKNNKTAFYFQVMCGLGFERKKKLELIS